MATASQSSTLKLKYLQLLLECSMIRSSMVPIPSHGYAAASSKPEFSSFFLLLLASTQCFSYKYKPTGVISTNSRPEPITSLVKSYHYSD